MGNIKRNICTSCGNAYHDILWYHQHNFGPSYPQLKKFK